MKNLNIYKYIEEFDLNKTNFLEFVTTLCNYFSEKFKVRKCEIKIINLEAMNKYGGYIPPARFGYKIRKYKNLDTDEEIVEKIEESIDFSLVLLENINKARIVKLAGHEWMHFYDSLVKWDELKIQEANKQYQDLILKSHQYDEMQESIRNKYQDIKVFICIDKLSAKETVADKFAQTFLKELYENILDENLKRKIEEEVVNHDRQVEEYRHYLNNNEIEEDCVLEQ